MANPTAAGTLGAAGNPKLRVGFVPLNDCAPLVMAQELGLFEKYGLRVELSRELGWATIRDKIIHRELDAAHALATMPVTISLGLGSVACDCLTGTGAEPQRQCHHAFQRAVETGRARRQNLARGNHAFPPRKNADLWGGVSLFVAPAFTAALVFGHGIDPEHDVRIVVVPPPQMVANLQAGHLDGFCVGEPWNSVAVQSRRGLDCGARVRNWTRCIPKKCCWCGGDFAERRHPEHLAPDRRVAGGL